MGLEIEAVSACLPETILTNEELVASQRVPFSAEDIVRKTGIASRHVSAERESTSDFAVRACEKLFAGGVVNREEIDWVIFCTQTPDYPIATTACILQDRLGLSKSTACFEVNLACSGFVYSLVLADSLLAARHARKVLLINGDCYTKFLRRDDASVNTLFGDGATATVLGWRDDPSVGLLAKNLGTDGSEHGALIRRFGGSRQPFPPSVDASVDNYIQMDGPGIFRFVQNVIPRNVMELLASRDVKIGDVDIFLFHQASRYMLDSLRRRLGMQSERLPVAMEDTGNLVSASIPLLIRRVGAIAPEKLRGSLAVLCAFGAGLSYGSLLYRFPMDGTICLSE